MASWLDPNSEVRYENKQQLISDISRLNNYYLAGKNQRLTSNEAKTNYDNALIGGTSVAGAVMAGTETTRNNRQAAADAGGFGAYAVGGGQVRFRLLAFKCKRAKMDSTPLTKRLERG